MTHDTWGQIRETLRSSVGKNNYRNWIEPLEFERLENGVATFLVPTQFMGNWVSRNFGDQILHELTAAGERVVRVEFAVPSPASSKNTAAAKAQKKPAKSLKVVRDEIELPGAPLDGRFTFDTFVVGKPNELAHAAARRVA